MLTTLLVVQSVIKVNEFCLITGRKRKSEEVLQEQVPEENNIYNTSYTCIKCDLKFNR